MIAREVHAHCSPCGSTTPLVITGPGRLLKGMYWVECQDCRNMWMLPEDEAFILYGNPDVPAPPMGVIDASQIETTG